MQDEDYMSECIRLAKKGTGFVSPNPLVGCLIVKDGKVIGRGYHKKFGGPHAEVEAIKNATRSGNSVRNSIMYVNLEPCSHYGKTPPCTELLVKNKISKVVIGIKDPNPVVYGIKFLKQAGISVKTGVLRDECIELNKFFLKHQKSKLPYVTLKIAQSADGKIADKNGKSKYITGIESRKYVHKLRAEYDAVLVGANTVRLDNPELTVRDFKGRDPVRVIVSNRNSFKKNRNVFKDNNFILVTNENTKEKNAIYAKSLKGNLNLKDTLYKLAERGISSVLVEGGAKIFSQFIKYNLVDEIIFISAPVIIGNGLSAFEPLELNKLHSSKKLNLVSFEKSGNDIISTYKCSQE